MNDEKLERERGSLDSAFLISSMLMGDGYVVNVERWVVVVVEKERERERERAGKVGKPFFLVVCCAKA